ncbi:MAG: hypothetical protein DHS20C11_16600 [Lysobacteraceae bacterium]|nr:MAG: hypothetical protein DHS20C11_16600 [Xanthomonadaceae bacterium]
MSMSGVRVVVIFPSTHVYGMERSTLELVRQLKKSGADICLLVNELRGEAVRRIADDIGVVYEQTQFWHKLVRPRSPMHLVRILGDWWSISGNARRAVKRFDATHVLCPGLEFFLYSLRTGRRAIRIFALPNPPDAKIVGWKGWVYRWVWNALVARNAHWLVCNSNFTRRELESMVGPRQSIRVIYRCAPERPPCKPAPKLSASGMRLLFAGQLTPSKGLHLLLDACEDLVDQGLNLHLTVAGSAPDGDYATEVVDRLQKLGKNNFYYAGYVEDIPGLLKQVDLLVAPSVFDEPLGIVVLEAKRAGRPALVFPSGGLTEMIEDQVDGWVCADKSADALAAVLKRLANSRETLMQAAAHAQSSYVRFNAETMIAAWSKVLTHR